MIPVSFAVVLLVIGDSDGTSVAAFSISSWQNRHFTSTFQLSSFLLGCLYVTLRQTCSEPSVPLVVRVALNASTLDSRRLLLLSPFVGGA
jgi:hypothetical protein